MKSIDPRCFTVACWIAAYAVEHHGNSPSLSEIAEGVKFNETPAANRTTVIRVVERMFRYGIAERIDGKLILVGSTYVPPTWYLDNVPPIAAEQDKSEYARRYKRPAMMTA